MSTPLAPTKVDTVSDSLYIRLDESRIIESEEVKPGVMLDYDEDERVVGIEFLNISSRARAEELRSMHFETA